MDSRKIELNKSNSGYSLTTPDVTHGISKDNLVYESKKVVKGMTLVDHSGQMTIKKLKTDIIEQNITSSRFYDKMSPRIG
jgi:hypothetical protein